MVAGQQYQGARSVLQSPDNRELTYALKHEFIASSNESKYEALIVGLCMRLALNIEQLIIRGDSKVVSVMSQDPLKQKRIT